MGGTIEGRRCPVVLGREALLRDGCSAIAAAVTGGGGCLALVGDEGMGKSRLLGELAEAGRTAGLTVLVGRAVPPDRSSPYRPLSEALAGLLRAAGASDGGRPTRFIPALAGIVPLWPAGDGQGHSPLAVAEATLGLLRTLAPQGALLLLEDLHWSDLETLAAVEFLADNARDQHLLVVVTARPDESRPLDDLLRALCSRGAVEQEALGPLGRGEVLRMARACLDGEVSPALVDLLAERSDGVPLLVEELLAWWREHRVVARRDGGWEVVRWPAGDTPEWYAAAVRDQLAGFDGTGRAALGAAAVLGRSFDWRTAAAVAGIDEQAMGRAVQVAVAAHLLEEDLDGGSPHHRFRRALTRDAVLDALSPWERRELSESTLAGPPRPAAPFGLSAREVEVLGLVEEGLTNRAIALRLSISHRTVEKHVEHLVAKTEARNRAHLGAIAALRLHVVAPVLPVEPVALRVVGP